MRLRDVLKWAVEAIQGPKTIAGPVKIHPETSTIQMERLVASEITKDSGAYSIQLVTTLRPTFADAFGDGDSLTSLLSRVSEQAVDAGPIAEKDLEARFQELNAKLQAGQSITRGLSPALVT